MAGCKESWRCWQAAYSKTGAWSGSESRRGREFWSLCTLGSGKREVNALVELGSLTIFHENTKAKLKVEGIGFFFYVFIQPRTRPF
jgi:hypothetical protein